MRAKLLHKDGYRVVAVSDSRGGVYLPVGLGIRQVIEQKNEHGRMPDIGEKVSNEQLLELDVDVLVPAALEDQITGDNAADVKAKVMIELANGPTTGDADAILHEQGCLVVPDVLANAGGVTVSWFEWLQNRAGIYWELEEVHKKLRRTIQAQFRTLHARMTELKAPMRTAAYAVALERLDSALSATGTAKDFQKR
jgi:glutamate dehydrogenase/leucine dehydrogenase